MKRKILTGVLLILAIFLFSYKSYIQTKENDDIIVVSENEDRLETSSIYISIYDPTSNKIVSKELEIQNVSFLTKKDYVNLVLKNSDYLSPQMNLLSIYEMENTMLVVLSNDFSKLSTISFVGTTKAIKETLMTQFDIKDISVQIEGNLK